MGPVLCDGLDGQLVLTQRSLLHDGDGGQRSSLRALDDAADSTYRRGRDGGKRLHFHWSRKEASPLVPEGTALWRARPRPLTFDLLVFSATVFLRFCADFCCRLCSNCCHSDGGDLVDDLHRLHHGGGATRCGDDGRRSHGVGYRLDGSLRHGPVHGDQHRLVVERGACQQPHRNATSTTFWGTFSDGT